MNENKICFVVEPDAFLRFSFTYFRFLMNKDLGLYTNDGIHDIKYFKVIIDNSNI